MLTSLMKYVFDVTIVSWTTSPGPFVISCARKGPVKCDHVTPQIVDIYERTVSLVFS